MEFDTRLTTDQLIKSKNIAENLSKGELDTLAREVIREYNLDLESRAACEIKKDYA